MEKTELLSYEAPRVEVIEVEVEKGFATSPYDVNATGNDTNMGAGTGSF